MSPYNYERLSVQDNTFLLMENDTVYMHVAAVTIFEAGELATPEGGVDIEKYTRAIQGVLHLVPRYRQKLKWIPYANHPVWVDDRHFKIDYHIRHTSLPRPGNADQLKKLAARIMAQQLDRNRPLWENWVVEGLEGGRFAVINKTHHCMIDGSSGADLATVLFSLTPEHDPPDIHPYIPRAAPSSAELLRDQLMLRMQQPADIVRGIRDFSAQTEDIAAELSKRAKAVGELLGYAVKAASETPLNGSLGPHRCFDWLEMPLERAKALRRAFDCTLNDVVLATVTGAVRSYLLRRRVDPDDIDFRVSAPVSVRREEDRGELGNKVSSWIVQLPVDQADPRRRLEALHAATQRLKKSEQALGVQMMMKAAEIAPAQLLSLGAQAASGPINMIVTNVPGPQFPLYQVGAKLVEMFPMVPLLENTGLGVALFSYDGKLFWGFNADPDIVPDLTEFRKMIEAAFEELEALVEA